MKKELLSLAVACLLCVPAFAADEQKEPEGVSDIKEIGKVIRNPLTIEASGNAKMNVVFNHAAHKRLRCQTCHHEQPSDIDAKYVGCGASEECHALPTGDDGGIPSLFKAFHSKDSDHSCYGCHMQKRKQYTGFQKGCAPCHETVKKDPTIPGVTEKSPR